MAEISEGDQSITAFSPAFGPRISEVRPKRDGGAETSPLCLIKMKREEAASCESQNAYELM